MIIEEWQQPPKIGLVDDQSRRRRRKTPAWQLPGHWLSKLPPPLSIVIFRLREKYADFFYYLT